MSERESTSEAGRLDPAVVAALYARHAVELRAYLTGLLRDPDLAAEVLQSTFARATELGHTAQEGSLRAWLFRVAHHEAIDRRRRSAREKRSIHKAAWWKAPSHEEDPARQIDLEETSERVRTAIEHLTPEQREIVRLRIYDDKTFAEIAELTQSPLGTVLTRMRLATKKLAHLLRSEHES